MVPVIALRFRRVPGESPGHAFTIVYSFVNHSHLVCEAAGTRCRQLSRSSWLMRKLDVTEDIPTGHLCCTAGLRSRCAYSLFQIGRCQLPEVPEIELINTFYRASSRAAQQQRVVNCRADSFAACHRVQCLQIVLFAERFDLKMRQDVIGDDARRFNRMDARLDRQARECGKHFRDRVQAHKPLVPPGGDAQQRRPGLRVVRMALLGGGNQNCGIEENVHLATLSKRTEAAPRAHPQGCVPSLPPVRRGPDGPTDHRP